MSAPPRLAVWILRRICAPGTQSEVEGDLQEAYTGWLASRGAAFARRRYWKEVALLAGWRIARRSTGTRLPESGSPSGGRVADLFLDVRYALRRIVQNPGSSGIAVLILSIGLGGNAMVFTLVDRVFLEPPPHVRQPERLVGLDWVMSNGSGVDFGYYDVEYYREHAEALEDVLAYGGFPGTRGRSTTGGGGEVTVGRGADLQPALAWVVSENYFEVLGAPLTIGAGFTPRAGVGTAADPEVVISHAFWRRRLSADPNAVDRPLYVNGVAFRLAGIAPETFRGINPGEPPPDLYVSILSASAISAGFDDALRRFDDEGQPNASRFLRLIARLRPGLNVESAQARMDVLQQNWEAEFGAWARTVYGESYRVRLRSEFRLAPFEARQLRSYLVFVWFVVGSVFLIGCTNLAILLLASASGREREMGIRAALGAGRSRLLAQLVTESLVLSVLGGAAGLGLAWLGAGALSATLPMNAGIAFTPDRTVAAFAFVLAGVAAVLFGTAPAWKLSRLEVVAALHRPGHSRTRALFRGALVMGQTALSILLLIGGGLMARSLQQAQNVDLGFDPDRRLILSLWLQNNGYDEDRGRAFFTEALDRFAAVPGVRHVSACNRLPFLGSNTWPFTAPGTEYAEQGLETGFNMVGPGYFETMGIGVVAGRAFTADDTPSSARVAMVNQVTAEKLWPGQNPVGRTLDFIDQRWTVVGVTEDAVYYSVREAPRGQVYFPFLQLYSGRMSFIVATGPATAGMAGPLETALREIDPTLSITPMTLRGLVDEQLSDFRVWTAFAGIYAGIAFVLALVGLYGVQSFLVSRRTREIGIRIALGADTRRVLGGVVRSGLVMGGAGALVGTGAALATTRLMRGLLFGVAPTDPLIFLTVPLLLVAACLAASLIPALRASAVNPVETLRRE